MTTFRKRSKRERRAARREALTLVSPLQAALDRVRAGDEARAAEHERTVLARKRRAWPPDEWCARGHIDREWRDAAEDYVDSHRALHGAGAAALDPGRPVVDAGAGLAAQERLLPEAARWRRYAAALPGELRALVDPVLIDRLTVAELARKLAVDREALMRRVRDGLALIARARRALTDAPGGRVCLS